PRHWWSHLDLLSAGAAGEAQRRLPVSVGTNDYGPSSTNYGLHESDATACALGSHHLPGARRTQPAARIHSGRLRRWELCEMDVLGDRVPHPAAAHQLVS